MRSHSRLRLSLLLLAGSILLLAGINVARWLQWPPYYGVLPLALTIAVCLLSAVAVSRRDYNRRARLLSGGRTSARIDRQQRRRDDDTAA